MATKRLREGVRRGRIRCSVRERMRLHVKVGGRYPMDDGHIVVDSITPIKPATSPAISPGVSFDSVKDPLEVARHGKGEQQYQFKPTCSSPAWRRRQVLPSTRSIGLAAEGLIVRLTRADLKVRTTTEDSVPARRQPSRSYCEHHETPLHSCHFRRRPRAPERHHHGFAQRGAALQVPTPDVKPGSINPKRRTVSVSSKNFSLTDPRPRPGDVHGRGAAVRANGHHRGAPPRQQLRRHLLRRTRRALRAAWAHHQIDKRTLLGRPSPTTSVSGRATPCCWTA